MDDDQVCPRCKTTKYRNPSLKLMVNICGHALCENCVELLFVKGSGACVECGIPLRRNSFRVQIFEDAVVEKEVDIRKRVLRDFNKKEDDFETLREYNNYLEEVESIIFNLANNINIVATNKRIEQYKKENKDLIIRNNCKLTRDEFEIANALEQEKAIQEMRKKVIAKEENDEKKKQLKSHESLIDDLMFSDGDAHNILETHAQAVHRDKEQLAAKRQTRRTHFSTGIKQGHHTFSQFLPIPKQQEGPLYVYEEAELYLHGPVPPRDSQLEPEGFIFHVKAAQAEERAAGYVASIACLRAIQEAFCGLYFVPERKKSSSEDMDTS